MKRILLYTSLFLTSYSLKAQAPSLLWENSIGGTTDDYGFFVEATADGGSICLGSSTSPDGDMTANFGNYDVLLSKLDNAGNIQWVKNLGGTNLEEGYTVHPTIDGGYFITGYTLSNDVNITLNHGLKDIWVVKTNAVGTIQWQKTYGGTADERAYYTSQTSDGGYIMAGYTESTDNDVTFNNGGADVWIVKVDSSGTLQWQKSLGGTGNDYGYFISQTTDGGFIVTANSDSNDGDVTGYHGGGSDVWIVKITSTGSIQWQKCYGGSLMEYGTAAYSTPDGGYIFSAYTESTDGDVSSNHGEYDNWLVKLNALGSIQWQKTYGGSRVDANYSFIKTLDKNYILAGYTYSPDGDVTGVHLGDADYWVMKTDTAGTLLWQTCLGGSADDEAFSITQNADSSYVVAGLSNAVDGDVTANGGTYDCWVVHLEMLPVITAINVQQTAIVAEQATVFPNPSSGECFLKNAAVNSLIEIYDGNGKCIFQKKMEHPSEKIDLSTQPKGIYFFRLTEEHRGVRCGKISIQ